MKGHKILKFREGVGVYPETFGCYNKIEDKPFDDDVPCSDAKLRVIHSKPAPPAFALQGLPMLEDKQEGDLVEEELLSHDEDPVHRVRERLL